MRRRHAWALLPLTACAQLAGIDNTTGPDSSGAVTLTLDRTSIGASVVSTPLDLTTLSATYLIADAVDPTVIERVPADAVATGVWSAQIPSGVPSVLFSLPDVPVPYFRIFDGLGRNVHAPFEVPEHPNPVPPDAASSTITMNVTLDAPYAAATESLAFYVVGAWGQHAFVADAPLDLAPTLTSTFDYAMATSISGRPLARVAAADAPLVLEYTAGALTAALEVAGFDQTAPQTITGTMTTVPHDLTIATPVAPAAISSRFTAGRPSVAGFDLRWLVTAAPGYRAAQTIGPRLAGGVVGLADATIDATYGNPFLAHDWHSAFALSATTSRTYTSPAPESLPLTLAASLVQVTDGTAIDTSLPAPLPVLISIDDLPISTDGVDVPLSGTAPVKVTFVNDKPTAATLYAVLVLEVAPNQDLTALVTTPKVQLVGTKPLFSIPPEMFVVDHRYVLRATTITGGYDDLANGNLTARSLPYASGSFDSGVFTVKAQP
ncbi:MAG: hypothetical protein NT062_07270 [Proteobacteria bacterium]|nr:hypothetical protein [Pseudomonadota bacterium]